MEQVSTAASSSYDDAYAKGWNETTEVSSVAESQAATEVSSVAESHAVTEAASEIQSSQQTEVASVASSTVTSPVETAAASVHERTRREERLDEKRPDDPVAQSYWSRWKTSSGLLEKEKAARSVLESELAKERTARTQPVSAAASEQQSVDVIDSLIDREYELLVEGNRAEAMKVRKQINSHMESSVSARITSQFEQRTIQTIDAKDEGREVSGVVEKIYAVHPELNIEGETANPRAIRYVQAAAGVFMDQGFRKAQAISMAASEAAPIFFAPVMSAAVTVAETAASSAPVDHNQLKAMAPVKTKAAPVKIDQKPKGGGSFEAGWNSA